MHGLPQASKSILALVVLTYQIQVHCMNPCPEYFSIFVILPTDQCCNLSYILNCNLSYIPSLGISLQPWYIFCAIQLDFVRHQGDNDGSHHMQSQRSQWS